MKLFVERKVINASDLHSWYKSQGLSGMIPPEEYHVTVVYSKEDVDITTMDFDYKPILIEGSMLSFLALFDDYVVQLVLTDARLYERFQYFKDLGCSWDYPEYMPHVSLAKGHKGKALTVEPYPESILLGPEVWSELNEDFSYKVEK